MPTFADGDKIWCRQLHLILNQVVSKLRLAFYIFCPARWKHRPRDNRYLRWCSGKCRHPCLKQTSPKHKRIFANKDEINQLKDRELVKKDSSNDGYDKPSKLGHNHGQVRNAQYFGTNNATDSDWWNPKRIVLLEMNK